MIVKGNKSEYKKTSLQSIGVQVTRSTVKNIQSNTLHRKDYNK